MENEFKPGMMVKTAIRAIDWTTVEVAEACSMNPHEDIFTSTGSRLSNNVFVMFLHYHPFEQCSFSKILYLNKVYWIRTKYLRLLNEDDIKTL